ncbi:MAG: NAD-dependent epimerase/dehydratase family protein, partial [Ghiorsea sp.]|nr:NAD-dependent epimerase/dehydratase family protein [Ghiorsea sp.]
KAIAENKTIDVYNHGKMQRDFTYIDDVVEAVVRLTEQAAKYNYKIYNIGNHHPETLEDFIVAIEHAMGKKADKNYLPMQAGDVPSTYADVEDLRRDVGFTPATSLQDGITKFVTWYKDYYGVNQ